MGLDVQLALHIEPVILLNPIFPSSSYQGHTNPLEAARQFGFKPKIIVVQVDLKLYIAIGFDDSHDLIATSAFMDTLGEDWKANASEYGGARLELDFISGRVELVGKSLGLREVPTKLIAPTIQEIRRLMNEMLRPSKPPS
jgi:hypothetical protein